MTLYYILCMVVLSNDKLLGVKGVKGKSLHMLFFSFLVSKMAMGELRHF